VLEGIPTVRPELLALQLFDVCSYGRAERLTEWLWSERVVIFEVQSERYHSALVGPISELAARNASHGDRESASLATRLGCGVVGLWGVWGSGVGVGQSLIDSTIGVRNALSSHRSGAIVPLPGMRPSLG